MPQLYDLKAPKKPTNLSINSDLLSKARASKINLSATLERALTQELRQNERENWKNENREATLSWKQNGQSYTKPLTGNKQLNPHPDYPYKAVVTILDNGGLEVYLD